MAVINKVDSIEELDELFKRSRSEPVVLFKHSNSCGISSHVLEMASEIEGELNVIVIQENRPLSNEVAVRTGYTHQSPQAFVLVRGSAGMNNSPSSSLVFRRKYLFRALVQ